MALSIGEDLTVNHRKIQGLSLVAFAATLSACVSGHNQEPVLELEVREQHRIELTPEPGTRVILNAIPGEVLVSGHAGTEIFASVEMKCRPSSERCREYYRDLAFAIESSGDATTVGFNDSDLGSQSDGELTIRLRLPRLAAMTLNLPAGRIDVRNIEVASLIVDVTAGDITIAVPEQTVSSIDLDATFGDASVRTGDRVEHARRSNLVGAEMHREMSDSGTTIRADVEFGNIQLSLTD